MEKTDKLVKLIESLSNQIITCSHILDEDVFINGTNKRKNTATLTYDNRGYKRNKGNLLGADMVKTTKMNNASGSDTYEVKLKNGLTSYNITDINGTEVMHYFKKKFQHEKVQIKMGDTSYDLEMVDSEFKQFMTDFLNKVNAVVQYHTNKLQKENKDITFEKICLYPVPSSSNFNTEMVKRIAGKHTINNLPCTIVNSSLLVKDTSKLTKDENFIQKNQEYYNSQRSNDRIGTHLDAIENNLSKLLNLPKIQEAINVANEYTNVENRKIKGKLLILWQNIKTAEKEGRLTQRSIDKLDEMFTKYQLAAGKIIEASRWLDILTNVERSQQIGKVAKAIKYSKGPSIAKRKEEIKAFLKKYKKGKNLPKTLYDVCMWQPVNFQIKNLGNDVRMALKNYFAPNKDQNLIKQELDKTYNSVVVIFDDNISGGATLSDICSQLQKLGIQYIIPITFGKMRESYNVGHLRLNAPTNGFNYN